MKTLRTTLLAAACVGALCVVAGLFLSAASLNLRQAQQPVGLYQLLQEAQLQDAPYRNAVYLYLRVAGVVWVAVEWLAAIILWRAYRLLTRAVKRQEDASHG